MPAHLPTPANTHIAAVAPGTWKDASGGRVLIRGSSVRKRSVCRSASCRVRHQSAAAGIASADGGRSYRSVMGGPASRTGHRPPTRSPCGRRSWCDVGCLGWAAYLYDTRLAGAPTSRGRRQLLSFARGDIETPGHSPMPTSHRRGRHWRLAAKYTNLELSSGQAEAPSLTTPCRPEVDVMSLEAIGIGPVFAIAPAIASMLLS
jgi:hypothetical protein